MRFSVLLLCFFFAINFFCVQGQDWAQWRGPHGNSISQETNWNPQNITSPKIVWEKNVGEGFATISIQKDYLYTIGNQKKKDTIYCLDRKTGKEIWTYSYACGSGSYPGSRATPVIYDGLLYSFSREGHIICLNATSGKLQWSKNLQEEYDPELPTWGFASSPIVSGNKLLLNFGEHGIAFDKTNGKLLWKSDPSQVAGYASVITTVKDGTEYAVIFSGKGIYWVNLNTGVKKWSYPWTTSWNINAADPIIFENRMFISSGYGVGCASFSLEGSLPKLVWKNEKMRSHFGTCILLDGYLYGIDGQTFGGAVLKCLDFKTSEEKWSKSIGFGSVIASDGKLLVLTDTGKVIIAKATHTSYQEISSGIVMKPSKHVCWNIPVLSYGFLYCRNSGGQLVCVDLNH